MIFVCADEGLQKTWDGGLCWNDSEIPSGMCAKLRTVAASNNRDRARNLSHYCLLAPHILCCYSSCTSRSWWTTQSTQHHRRGCNNIPSFLQWTTPIARSLCVGLNSERPPHPGRSTILLMCLSLCNTQARTVNLIHAILCDDEGVTQARGCLRHGTDRGVERWLCKIYCLEFCACFNGAKRQHLSTINTNSDLSFTTIQKQTYRRKQLMDQSDDNSLTTLLTEREQVRFREVVNTCTERRAEKRIQRTA